MSRTSLDVSVIVCSYTQARWNDLIIAVESVQCQTVPPSEIIVVLDHNPNLLRRVRTNIPDVIALENRESRGLSGARNSGVAAARGAVIAFLDDDAVATSDWLAQLIKGYEDPQVVGVGGAIDPIWQTGRPKWFPEEFNWVVGGSYRGMPQRAASVRNLIGCNMSFRRKVFEAIGGFRSGIGRVGQYPVGCEETEFCIRIHQLWPQSVLLYEPRARVHHRVTNGRASWNYFLARCYAEGLSKARVSQLVGMRDGLASERTYAFRALPQGVAQGMVDTVLHGDLTGLGRVATILAGLGFTTTGYFVGAVSERIRIARGQANVLSEVA